MEEYRKDPIPVRPTVIGGSWKELAARWLFDQGAPVVILVGILSVLGYGIPYVVIPEIQRGYEQNVEALQKTANIYIEARDREVDAIVRSQDRDRQMFERAVSAMEQK